MVGESAFPTNNHQALELKATSAFLPLKANLIKQPLTHLQFPQWSPACTSSSTASALLPPPPMLSTTRRQHFTRPSRRLPSLISRTSTTSMTTIHTLHPTQASSTRTTPTRRISLPHMTQCKGASGVQTGRTRHRGVRS